MRDFVLTLLVVLVAWITLVVVAGTALLWALRRANRVDPRTPTSAPLHWLWWPSRPAGAHRRLRRIAMTLATIPDPTGDTDAGARLLHEAVALDAQLVACGRLSRPERAKAEREVLARIDRLASLTGRLGGLAQAAAPFELAPAAQTDRVLDVVDEQIGSFEAAHGELDALERVPRPRPPASQPQR